MKLLQASLFLAATASALAAPLVDYSSPADGDRATFRAPVSLHLIEPIELDSDGDGSFTPVASSSIEGGSFDIVVEVNSPGAPNRVVFELDSDGDPATPGGTPVSADAAWDLRDYPPMLRIRPAADLARDALYRVIAFEGGGATARSSATGVPVDPYEFTFRTLPAGGTGAVQTISFFVPSLGYNELYNVYLPPGYGDSTAQRYSTMYLLHGGFGSYQSWNGGGVVETIANGLIDSGEIEPTIIVMPDGNSGFCITPIIPFHRLWSNSFDGTALYGDYTAYDLVDDVENRFQSADERRMRGVGGLSMGGFGAASVGLGHTEQFSFVAPLAGWQHSVRMTSSPDYPNCSADHWTEIPELGDECFVGQMLQGAIGPAGADLTHLQSVVGYDLALATEDNTFRGQIFLAHGDADGTATVEWSDDISCALEQQQAAHCYKRPPGVGHDGDLWNVALEEDLLPRMNAIAYWAELPPQINDDCINATLASPLDVDRDGIAGDGDGTGFPGDGPCAGTTLLCDDNCRDTPNPSQLDFDLDGDGDLCDADDDNDGLEDSADCGPLDPGAGLPGVIDGLTVSGGTITTIDWADLALADSYDLVRGNLSSLGSSFGSCLATGITASDFEDATLPPAGDGFFYYVRGQDAACGGAGPFGSQSDGSPRTPTACN